MQKRLAVVEEVPRPNPEPKFPFSIFIDIGNGKSGGTILAWHMSVGEAVSLIASHKATNIEIGYLDAKELVLTFPVHAFELETREEHERTLRAAIRKLVRT